MKYTFEEGMEKLEALVSRLEKGDMALEDSFKAYHEASALYRSFLRFWMTAKLASCKS